MLEGFAFEIVGPLDDRRAGCTDWESVPSKAPKRRRLRDLSCSTPEVWRRRGAGGDIAPGAPRPLTGDVADATALGDSSPLFEVVNDVCASRRGLLFESEDSEIEDWRRFKVPLGCCASSGRDSSGMRTADEIIVGSGIKEGGYQMQ